VIVATPPVIPNYGTAHGCITNDNALFCTTWIRQHWHDTLEPAIVQHLWLTAIAVGIGFAIAFLAALVAHRYGFLAAPFGVFSAILYTIPSIALFQVLVPFTGITVTTIEIGLVGYTLLILLRNILAGLDAVPSEVKDAARGMGYGPVRLLALVEMPLALPAVFAGVRIATVTTIGLVTVASLIGEGGLGYLLLDGFQRDFRTEELLGAALAVALAFLADLAILGIQRATTPWSRVGEVR